MRHSMTAAGAVMAAALLAGCAGAVAGGSRAASTPPASTAPPPATTAPAPVTPSPDGTFQGSCDYTLGDNPAEGTAQAVGDIDAANTGNIGIVVKLTITWPQEGHAPLSLSRTVRIPQGGEQDVQFSRPLSGDQVDLLQSYQTGHDYKDGCTYKGDMTATFGSAT